MYLPLSNKHDALIKFLIHVDCIGGMLTQSSFYLTWSTIIKFVETGTHRWSSTLTSYHFDWIWMFKPSNQSHKLLIQPMLRILLATPRAYRVTNQTRRNQVVPGTWKFSAQRTGKKQTKSESIIIIMSWREEIGGLYEEAWVFPFNNQQSRKEWKKKSILHICESL